MTATRTSANVHASEETIDGVVGLLSETIVHIGEVAKRELRCGADLRRMVEDLAEQLATAGTRIAERDLAISRLQATWREIEFGRHVQVERADRHSMELAQVDTALDEAERLAGVAEDSPRDDRVGRIRALAEFAKDRSRDTAQRPDAAT